MLQKSTVAVIVIACTVITGVAWQKIPQAPTNKPIQQDTIPAQEKKYHDQTVIKGDLDSAMEEVKRAQENLELQLQKGGLDKMHNELLKAQSELNKENIHLQLEKAAKEINLQKINMDAQLKNMDVQEIQKETMAALQKINWENIQKDLLKAQESLRNNVDQQKLESDIRMSMEQTKKAMEELKALDMEKIRLQLDKSKEDLKLNEGKIQEEIERARKDINENLHRNLKKELEKAKEQVQHAKEQLQEYKNMLEEMNKEGLLSSKEEYHIEYNSGSLNINGIKQPENITNKYKHYFKREHIIISRNQGDDKKVIDL